MKKHHITLLFLMAGIIALLLKQSYDIKQTESQVQTQLNLLRHAIQKSPTHTTSQNAHRTTRKQTSSLDTGAILARLNVTPTRADFRQYKMDLSDYLENQLTGAPISELKELCALIEKNFPLDQEKNVVARDVWLAILAEVSQSDPAWAFKKLEHAANVAHAPISETLDIAKQWSTSNSNTMQSSYADALDQWLNQMQSAGKIQEDHPLVAALRAEIAIAQANTPAAIKFISQLPLARQQNAAAKLLAHTQTATEKQQAIQAFSNALHPQNFVEIAAQLGEQQGFEQARDTLTSTSLPPEKFNLAAVGIAAAGIGPETAKRAEWLVATLRNDDGTALKEFASKWTQGNYADAAAWINHLPKGQQRDAALAGFIPAATTIDAATAIDWALTVSDPVLRRRLYQETHAKWQEIDAQGANEYKQQHTLDQEAANAKTP